MSKISIKYKQSASTGEIAALEKKYQITRENVIQVLRVYGYANGAEKISAIGKEPIVEYVEKQQHYTIQQD